MNSQQELSAAVRVTSSYSTSEGGECVEAGTGLAHALPARDSKVPPGTGPHACPARLVVRTRRPPGAVLRFTLATTGPSTA
ncbi:DUF397 domain-containing protein [Streptomyces sp. NPDC088258]|uniref:DUF397 domain-containing protein n=1 Tax=Streptomyces sp. NPDC088258 TaxID=3365849 RepID=UPI00382442F4